MKEITEQEYRDLKEEVESATAEAARAEGALNQLLSRIKEEFGCKDLVEAQALLEKLRKKQEKAKEAFETALTDYKKRWKDLE